jgi:sugar/nucleoside kinase (ribokinase family)
MTDVVARLRGPLVTGSDSPAPVLLTAGGSAANTSTWLAVTGARTALVGRVGADLAGDAALAALQSAGVDCHLARDPVRPTGTCIVLVALGGERTMVPDAGANGGLVRADVPEHLLGPQSHLHLSGYALLNAGSRDAALHALALAHARGATTSVDAASAGPLLDVGPAAFLGWVRGVDALIANADELRALTGAADRVAAALTLTAYAAEVVVKLGSEGALRVGRGSAQAVWATARPVTVVDTTGAGDAFAAGWLPAWLSGADPEVALRAGCALAARAVTRAGARPT